MKKLQITVNGVVFIVEVEVLQDDEHPPLHQQYQGPSPRYDRSPNPKLGSVQSSQPISKPAIPKVQNTSANELTSPINGLVLEILCKEGQAVKENTVLFVLESMKMKTNISSPRDGTIKEIKIKNGDMVSLGQILACYE